ncbi:porin [Agriterribacter sp.]|uniref:porin n=1 Tax=Agriterribacter sp. TaxID=2821509 RepID=UPI002CA69384|nr:porin [Agriterribacter sp.]HTN07929.1 porin [Agriterribacter sp.]
MKRFMTTVAVMLTLTGAAQDTTISKQIPSLTFSGYAEAYYSYDLNKPSDNNRPGFLYSHNRHNEFNANLAFIKASYNTERVRANLAIAAGTYMNANYTAEPGVLKNIYEANVGHKLSRTKNLWLDIGIMPSHIGFESAISKDCWALTRSLVAENSPYFESGAKLSYTTDNGKLAVSALALNGWQRITRVNASSLMSWGTQVVVKPTGNITLNYSTFIGTDKPDSTRRWRIYHNIYGIFQFTDKIGFTAGFDIGTEQVTKGSSHKNNWYSAVGIWRYTPASQWAIAVRGEYFNDEDGVIIAAVTPNGFKTSGFSLNVDYLPVLNIALRLEGRTLNSKDNIFIKNGNPESNTTAITFSAAVGF